MTKRSRYNHSAAFKAKIALSAIKGDKTLAQLGTRYDVHSNSLLNGIARFWSMQPTCSRAPGHPRSLDRILNSAREDRATRAGERFFLVGALGRLPGSSAKR